MNEDTRRAVAEIEARGWYPSHQTLGEGGWPSLYDTVRDWKRYAIDLEDTPTILARDDATAVAAFESLYEIPEGVEVREIRVSTRVVTA